MANGPFSVNPNSAAEISPVQLSGGFQQSVVDPDIGKAVGDIAQLAGNTFAAVSREKATKKVQDEISTVQDALDATFNPRFQSSVFADAAKGDAHAQGVMVEMARLRGAMVKGKLPPDFVYQRIRQVVRNATTVQPAFEDVFKKAAQDAVGFDPAQRLVGLYTQQLVEGPQQEAMSEFETAVKNTMDFSGWDRETSEAHVRQQFLLDLNITKTEAEQKVAGFDANRAINQYEQRASSTRRKLFLNILGTQNRARQEGNVFGDEQITVMIDDAIRQDKEYVRSQLPVTMSPAEMAPYLKQVDDAYEPLMQVAKDGRLSKFLEDSNKVTSELTKREAFKDEFIGQYLSLVGGDPAVVGEFLGQVNRWFDNPTAAATFFQSGASGQISAALVMNGQEDMLQVMREGTIPAGWDEERQQRASHMVAVFTNGRIKHATQGSQVVEAMDTLVETGPKGAALVEMARPEQARRIFKNKETWPWAINHFATAIGQFRSEYWDMLASGEIPSGGWEVTEEGIVRSPTPFVGGGIREERHSPAFKQWVDRSKYLFKAMKNAKAMGALPDSVYTNSDELFARITASPEKAAEAAGAAEPPQPKVYDPVNDTWISTDGNLETSGTLDSSGLLE